jgi:hypothetical protein
VALIHPDTNCYLIRLDYRDPNLEAIVRLASAAPGGKALRICVLFPSEVAAFKVDRHRQMSGSMPCYRARYPSAYFKLAHAPAMLGGQQFPFTKMNSKLRRIVDAFGANREMWASDATGATGGYTWAESLPNIRGAIRN